MFPRKKLLIAIAITGLLITGCDSDDDNNTQPLTGVTSDETAGEILENFALKSLKKVGKAKLKKLLKPGGDEEKKQLGELVTEMAEVEEEIAEALADLKEVQLELQAMDRQMSQDNFDLQLEFIGNVQSRTDVYWSQFLNIINDADGKPRDLGVLINNSEAVGAFEGFFSSEMLGELTYESTTLSGLNPTTASNDALSYLLQSRVSLINSYAPIQGTKSDDSTSFLQRIDDSNEALLSKTFDILQTNQKIYVMQRVALYLRANAPEDSPLKNLVFAENDVSISNTFSENLTIIDDDFQAKFTNIMTLTFENGFITDKSELATNDGLPAIKLKAKYWQGVPYGYWRNNCELYSWSGAMTNADDAYAGDYDGTTLEARCTYNASADDVRIAQSTLDLTQCASPSEDRPVPTSTASPYLSCNWLPEGIVSYSSHKETGYNPNGFSSAIIFDNSSYNLWETIRTPIATKYLGFRKGYADGNYSLLGANSTTVSNEAYGGEVTQPTWPLKLPGNNSHHDQIIQYNFANGERMLLQLGYYRGNPKFAQLDAVYIRCGDRKNTAAPYDWSCSDEGSTGPHAAGGGSWTLNVKSPSGEIAGQMILDNSYYGNPDAQTKGFNGYPVLKFIPANPSAP